MVEALPGEERPPTMVEALPGEEAEAQLSAGAGAPPGAGVRAVGVGARWGEEDWHRSS
jgi:hypothetical protein